ncbi:HlyD family type I secretion periplasmic adaptor subunit [Hwanghaeella sp.]|uniref:HlyD family type I secretion periplasmic adaptor subunit n=1 Tax=Hwanghaeella sp. TaxID=2605943 RepID=UPI003CCBD4F9
MLELLRRLFVSPWSALLLVVASVLANVLALAPPLFVIQIFNRFLAVGEVSTLLALVSGTAIAILFELMLRSTRFRLARAQGAVHDLHLYTGIGSLLSLASPRQLAGYQSDRKNDPIEALSRIQYGHGPQHICSLLDLPFSFVFVGIVFLIDHRLGTIAGGGALLMLFTTVFLARRQQSLFSRLTAEAGIQATRLRHAMSVARRMRLFVSSNALIETWRELAADQVNLARISAQRVSTQQNISLVLQAVQTVALISVGALLALKGELDVGSLIGVNILAARALAPISRFAAALEAANGAKEALCVIGKLKDLPKEAQRQGSLVGDLRSVELRNLGLRQSDMSVPYFTDVNHTAKPGSITAVYCDDANATLAMLDVIAKLRSPSEGGVLVNDVNLETLPFEWWRMQVGFVPAHPVFVAGTLAENFQRVRDEDREGILAALEKAGIRKAVEAHPHGLNMPLSPEGEGLPAEVRWRIGLARAIYFDAPIMLVEDPIEVLSRDVEEYALKKCRDWASDGKLVFIGTTVADHARTTDYVIELRRGQKAAVAVRQGETVAENALPSFTNTAAKVWDEEEKPVRDLPRLRWLAQGLTALVILFSGALGFWAYTAKLDTVTTADGEVVPSQQVQSIESLEGGIVARILVSEGQDVERGEPLLELQSVASDADIAELSFRLASLRLANIRLEAEITQSEKVEIPDEIKKRFSGLSEKTEALFRSRQARLRNDLAVQAQVVRQREQAIVEIRTKIKSTERQLQVVSEQVDISDSLLSSDLTSRMLHLNLVRDLTGLEAELAQATAAIKTAQAALEEAKTQREVILSAAEERARSELEEVFQQYGELTNRMSKLEDTKERTVLRSPMDGTVKALSTFTEGAVIGPGEVVAEVVPLNDSLLIEALLPVSEVGFVAAHMPVRIRLATRDAFRFQPIDGVIQRVSPDTFAQDEGETFYKMIVKTEQRVFQGAASEYALVPGLKVRCSVLLGGRTVFQYLADPLLRGMGLAFRER